MLGWSEVCPLAGGFAGRLVGHLNPLVHPPNRCLGLRALLHRVLDLDLSHVAIPAELLASLLNRRQLLVDAPKLGRVLIRRRIEGPAALANELIGLSNRCQERLDLRLVRRPSGCFVDEASQLLAKTSVDLAVSLLLTAVELAELFAATVDPPGIGQGGEDVAWHQSVGGQLVHRQLIGVP